MRRVMTGNAYNMTHSVIGFIAMNDFVHQICSKYPSLCAVPLEQGFSLFPLTRADSDPVDGLNSNFRGK